MALVHEWIAAHAGSEKVFESLAQIYPSADLFALSSSPDVKLETGGRRVRTTMLDRPKLRDRRSVTLPLMPFAWRALGRDRYDVVVSSHHAFAHTNRLAGDGIHLSYVHSPARYIWSPEIDERGASRLAAPAQWLLRRVDRRASSRITAYAANSSTVARRIEKYWNRDAVVIHPAVQVEYFAAQDPAAIDERPYVLGVGRWIPYKNLHLVIEAGERAGLPVKIAGRGPDKSRIMAAADAATVPVEIIESPTDDQLRDLYRYAACLVFPTVEDFGMVPVEAQATGTPVVALREGGALDTVEDGLSGVFAESTDPRDLAAAILRAVPLAGPGPRSNAQKFSEDAFRRSIERWVSAYAG